MDSRFEQCFYLEEYEEMIDLIDARYQLWLENRAEQFRYANQFRTRPHVVESCPF